MASFIPSHFTSCLVIFTCKSIVRFYISSWCLVTCTLEGNRLFSSFSHIVNDSYVNDTCIFTRIWWRHWKGFNSVTGDTWNCLVDGNHLSRIIWIVCISSCWDTWNWITIFINGNEFTKGLVSHCISCIWGIWSNCLTASYCFIRIVASHNWSLNCAVSMARCCPSCCVSCRIFFTAKAKVVLSVSSWCLSISTCVANGLTGCLSHIFSVFFNDNVVMVTWCQILTATISINRSI